MSIKPANGRAAALFLADVCAGGLAFAVSDLCAKGLGLLFGQAETDQGIFWSSRDVFLQAILFLSCVAYFTVRGHYSLKSPWWDQAAQILLACAGAFFISALVDAGTGATSLLRDALYWLLVPIGLISARWLVRSVALRNNSWKIPTVILGGGANARKCLHALAAEAYLVYDIRQVILSEAGAADVEAFSRAHPGVAVLTEFDPAALSGSYVVFCPEDMSSSAHQRILSALERNGLRFAYIPPIDSHFLYRAELRRFFGYGFVAIEARQRALSSFGRYLKVGFDKLGAAAGLLVLSPLFLLISFMIKKDGGPAIFGHKRIGEGGRTFTCLKFRSMVVNSKQMLEELLARDPEARAEYERDFKLKNDPRVTSIGKFLRKTSLDELPQLLNVLRGEMSLMGPRPIVEEEKKYYDEAIHDYASVRPGMTGLWQVSGRSDTGYAQRVYLDGWYVKNWSFWNDLIIFFRTINVVLGRKGAY